MRGEEMQLTYHTFMNPLSWLMGDRPLYNTAMDYTPLVDGMFEEGHMVWVRQIGEAEYRMGKIDKKHRAETHRDDTYDILFDDGEHETRVARSRIRLPKEEVQDEQMFCFGIDCCKGCGKQCQTGVCETCCGPCAFCGCTDCGRNGHCCGAPLSGEVMNKRLGGAGGNWSMRERAAVDP